MPTIDALPAAASVSDGDELMISQSLIARKATRAQIVSGLQASIFLPQFNLLGRISAGTGVPESIGIGANLSVTNGAMSAPAAFSVSGTSPGSPIQPADLVAIGQGGQNANLTYSAFMSGVSGLSGLDVSGLNVTAAGTPGGRSLAAIAGDAIPVEAFGAVGDGLTDDTSAFALALASGRAVRLDSKVYVINGVLAVTASTAMLGVADGTVLRRLILTNDTSWISIGAPIFSACGVIFDSGALAASDAPGVAVATTCDSASFTQCSFVNASGTVYGAGLALECASVAMHSVIQCSMTGNALHGMTASGTGAIVVTGCVMQGNGGYGISIGTGVGAILSNNICRSNQSGISIGGWTTTPFSVDTASPITICGNTCIGNTEWGLAVACAGATIASNTCSGNGGLSFGGGILARMSDSYLVGNLANGGACGIDCRGSSGCLVSDNMISGTATGIGAGSSQSVLISRNFLVANTCGISVSGIEPLIGPLPTSNVTINENWIGLRAAQGCGILVSDGAQTVAVTNNCLNGSGSATVDQSLWAHTDSAIIRGNTWNNATRFPVSVVTIANRPTLVVPDVADDAFVVTAPPQVQSILTSHQASTLGQVLFVRLLTGGENYSQASVLLSGTGSGAQAQAVIENGAVVWVSVTNPGSGYGDIGATVTVIINGDGSGATAQGYVGLPVMEGKRLRLACNTPVQLVQVDSVPPQTSWTGFATTVPAFGSAELEGTFGQWRAVQSPPVDYLAPTGNGGAVLQSVAGADLTLRPSSGGALQIASEAEPGGYVTAVGRGSPQGAVAAAPGSDFRNLDGGVGNTLWIKQSGTDDQGWIAVA